MSDHAPDRTCPPLEPTAAVVVVPTYNEADNIGRLVPLILARTLQAQGVSEDQISIIPDEQEAIDAALRMGLAGDLVLIFADALTRSWKQVIKFRPEGAAPVRKPDAPVAESSFVTAEETASELEGRVRDERGVRMGREEDD